MREKRPFDEGYARPDAPNPYPIFSAEASEFRLGQRQFEAESAYPDEDIYDTDPDPDDLVLLIDEVESLQRKESEP